MENKISLVTLQTVEKYKSQLINEVEEKLRNSVAPQRLSRTKVGKKWHLKLHKNETCVRKISVSKIKIPIKDYEIPKFINIKK